VKGRLHNTLQLPRDIRFWIVLFFVIRLIGITQPPLETAHNWRQTTVAMVARNFSEVDADVMRPRIDIAGEKTGITGMEFPVLNSLIYLVSEVFGYEHWYGRLVNLIISSVGMLFFFKVIREHFNEKLAFKATIILICSVWFVFSRKIMPDTMAMSLIIASIYFGCKYLYGTDRRGWVDLCVALILGTIGVLAKLPVAFLFVVYAPLLLKPSIAKARKLKLVGLFGLFLTLPALWYFYWVPHLVEAYGFWHFFMGKPMVEGMAELIDNWSLTLQRFYSTAIGFTGFAFLLLGLVRTYRRGNRRLLTLFGLTFMAFVLVVIKAGATFPEHSYYIIPFAPVMALMAAYGIEQLKSHYLMIAAVILIAGEGLLNQQHDFRISKAQLAIESLESTMDQVSERDELIIINSDYSPTPMYFAHRKGWIATNEQILAPGFLDSLQIKGLSYALILKRAFGEPITLGYPVVLENEDCRVYKME
jgi:hypothetical protein